MRFIFADHTLDISLRELKRGAIAVPVEPQVFDLLTYLVKNRDRVVTKDDLLGAIWGGRIVTDSTLTSRINAARKAVGDSGEEQKLIRTVARRGVRFIGDVEGRPVDIERARESMTPKGKQNSPRLAFSQSERRGITDIAHDAETRAAVFRKGHAQSGIRSGSTSSHRIERIVAALIPSRFAASAGRRRSGTSRSRPTRSEA